MKISKANFEKLANVAVNAVAYCENWNAEDRPSMKIRGENVTATRAFKTQLRRGLRYANIEVAK